MDACDEQAVAQQEESQRMTAVRKAYQKAVLAPIHLVEQIWKEYENFENSVSRALVGCLPFVQSQESRSKEPPTVMQIRGSIKLMFLLGQPLSGLHSFGVRYHGYFLLWYMCAWFLRAWFSKVGCIMHGFFPVQLMNASWSKVFCFLCLCHSVSTVTHLDKFIYLLAFYYNIFCSG